MQTNSFSEGFQGILHKPFSLAQLLFCLSGIWNEEATPVNRMRGEEERLRMILRLLRLLPKMIRKTRRKNIGDILSGDK